MLACTHYPLLLDRLTRLAPWPVDWIDPAPAIARRTSDLIGPARDARARRRGRACISPQARPALPDEVLAPFFGGRVAA